MTRYGITPPGKHANARDVSPEGERESDSRFRVQLTDFYCLQWVGELLKEAREEPMVFRFEVVLKTLVVFFITTTIVSVALRETQMRLLHFMCTCCKSNAIGELNLPVHDTLAWRQCKHKRHSGVARQCQWHSCLTISPRHSCTYSSSWD